MRLSRWYFEAEDCETEAQELSAEADQDPPEPLPPEGLDLGELVAQQLAVALDPYPRASGAEVAAAWAPAPQEEVERRSAFEVLRGMKGKS